MRENDVPDAALAPTEGVSKDVLRRRNAEMQAYIMKVNEQLAVVTRIATIAVSRLGDMGMPGTMRITEKEWASAEGSDMQWKTVRHPGLQPEIHVAATMQGEAVQVPLTPQPKSN
jgi:hypothetical protein